MMEVRRAALAPLAGAGLGVLLVFWAAGPRMLDPREVGWVMRGDWQIHFLGWHFFRHEPWHWPPGTINGLMQPIGTSLGYTDAIPLMAFLLKPLSDTLPPAFQYLGIWLLVCFALQGFFGALVISTWTASRVLQVLGAILFLLLPTLAARIAHPALCAHWLLLWALWLYWRSPVRRGRDVVDHAALGLAGGLVHPYLSVMTLALLLALAARRFFLREMPVVYALMPWALACSGVVLGWWMSGLFTLTSAADVTAASGAFSMNLLAVVNPGAIPSTFLDGFPAVSAAQLGEGYQYLGFGILVLCGVALAVAVKPGVNLRASIPLLVVLFALTVYSILPVIGVGRLLARGVRARCRIGGDCRVPRPTPPGGRAPDPGGCAAGGRSQRVVAVNASRLAGRRILYVGHSIPVIRLGGPAPRLRAHARVLPELLSRWDERGC
jgi:hypothetical protein